MAAILGLAGNVVVPEPGVKPCWVVVFSPPVYQRAQKTVDKPYYKQGDLEVKVIKSTRQVISMSVRHVNSVIFYL